MPMQGYKAPVMPGGGFGQPSAGAMQGAMNVSRIPPPMPNIGPSNAPMPLGVDPATMGLPPGAVLYDDGSVRLPAEFAQRFIGANQTGGANPVPPGLPPGFGGGDFMGGMMGGMMGGPPVPPGMTPPPGPPQPRAQMPGQPPPMPTAPADLAMMGPPPGPLPGPNVSVPGGASITNGMPSAAPMPKPEYEQADEAGGAKKTPQSRLGARGKKPAAKGKK